MTERDPRMLPGITASTAGNIGAFAIIIYIGLVLLVLIAGLVATVPLDGKSLPSSVVDPAGIGIGIGFVLAAALAVIFIPMARRKQRLELEAGYTTQLTEFNQVDGISSRTGQVVRPAVARPAGVATPGAFTTGIEIGAIAAGRRPFGIVLRSWSADLWLAGSVVATVAGVLWFIAGINTDAGPTFGSALLFILGLCAVGIVVGLEFQFVPPRYYRDRLARHFPDAYILTGAPGNSDLVTELVPLDAATLPDARSRYTGTMVFLPDRVIFFSRHHTDLLPFLVVPRARVTEAAQTTRSYGRSSVPAVNLTVTKDNGTSLTFVLELAVPGRKSLSTMTAQCQWIVGWAGGDADASAG